MIDHRARLRPKPAAENYVYGDMGGSQPSLLTILRRFNGMVWNYTPIINETKQVNYESTQPIHTNSGYNNYMNTSNTTLSVQSNFFAGTGMEAMYLLACIHFLRSVTYMDFGRQATASKNNDFAVVGAPPPILLFSAYGRYMYNDVPVIVKSFSLNFTDDVDYVMVPVNSAVDTFNITSEQARTFFQTARANGFANKENQVYVPQKLAIALQLEQQPTPDFMSKQFNLNAFKRGSMLRKGGFI